MRPRPKRPRPAPAGRAPASAGRPLRAPSLPTSRTPTRTRISPWPRRAARGRTRSGRSGIRRSGRPLLRPGRRARRSPTTRTSRSRRSRNTSSPSSVAAATGAAVGGRGGGGARGGRSAYQSAMDRERYGRGGGGGGINRYPDVSGRTASGDATARGPQLQPRRRPACAGAGRVRSSNEPWSDVPPELEAMLRAQVAQKPPVSRPSGSGSAPATATDTSAVIDRRCAGRDRRRSGQGPGQAACRRGSRLGTSAAKAPAKPRATKAVGGRDRGSRPGSAERGRCRPRRLG